MSKSDSLSLMVVRLTLSDFWTMKHLYVSLVPGTVGGSQKC